MRVWWCVVGCGNGVFLGLFGVSCVFCFPQFCFLMCIYIFSLSFFLYFFFTLSEGG